MVDYSKWEKIEESNEENEVQSTKGKYPEIGEKIKMRVQLNEEESSEISKLLVNKEKNETELKGLLVQMVKEHVNTKIKNTNADFSKKSKSVTLHKKSISNSKSSTATLNELGQDFNNFLETNEELCKTYGLLNNNRQSHKFLLANLQLVCQHTSNFLGLWCINVEMVGKHELMSHIARQNVVLQYILTLRMSFDLETRAAIHRFFSTIEDSSRLYHQNFEFQIEKYKEIIRLRAIEKQKELLNIYAHVQPSQSLETDKLHCRELLESLPKINENMKEEKVDGLVEGGCKENEETAEKP